MSCLSLGTTPALQEILVCTVQLAAGGAVPAAILMFLVMTYAIYKFKLPFLAALPITALVILVFAGAGDISNRIGGLHIFEILGILLILIAGGGIITFFLKFRR